MPLQAADGRLVLPTEMAVVDAAAIESGIPGPRLMLNAGRAVARAVAARFAPQPIRVLCGPGNNGGDGFVVAELLRRAGWPVRVDATKAIAALRGDAAWAASLWQGPIGELGETLGDQSEELVVDALFGAGLDRPLDGAAAAVVRELTTAGRVVVSVDVPSGLDGATGSVGSVAVQATLTVTFCRLKPGHVLEPGRSLCGDTQLADIGIPTECVERHASNLWLNMPARWGASLPPRSRGSHKYTFGHALVLGGPSRSAGAARLAASAALRVGAGLASVVCTREALPAYAPSLTTVMTKIASSPEDLARLLQDPRMNAVLVGPGHGVGESTAQAVLACLGARKRFVLDADALTSFASCRAELFGTLHGDGVLTPHDGEYARLFDFGGDRLTRARKAARQCGAVVLLKGADTVVAAPDGRAVINTDAPATLATAGTGDVLAGLIVGLLAQGVPAFEAASAGAWLHGAAARLAGGPLIAEDLLGLVPHALSRVN